MFIISQTQKKKLRSKVRGIQQHLTKYSNLYLVLITAVYVFATFQILAQYKRQNELILKSSKNIQRAYIAAEITDFTHKSPVITKQHPSLVNDCIVKLKFTNQGQTVAYPVIIFATVDSQAPGTVNYRDSMLYTNVAPLDTSKMNWMTTSLLPMDSIRYGIKNPQVRTNTEGYVFIQTYIIYKDVFDDYHDFTYIKPYVYDIQRRNRFPMPYIIYTHDFTKRETHLILQQLKNLHKPRNK